MNTTAQDKARTPSIPERARETQLQIYVSTIAAVGLLLNLVAIVQAGDDIPGILLFVMLVIIAEFTTSEVISPQMTFSMSMVVACACVLLFGALSASLVASVGGLATTVIRTYAIRRQGRRPNAPFIQLSLFNMAAYSIAAALAGATYGALGGSFDHIVLLRNLAPLAAAAVVNEMINAAVVIGAVSLQTGQGPFRLWRQNVSWALPMNVLAMVVGGGGLAMGFETTGILGAAIYFVPIAATIYAFRLYAERTKDQMAHLQKTIAEREQAQTQLQASLDEKEVLLKEIHHRVKNNLQVISSLLYVQARKVKDPEALEMFRESQNRVRAIALVHERLYQSQDLARIDFGKYLESLSHHWLHSYAVDLGSVRLIIDVKDVYLGIDTAVPCALLINELVSNALKHAFPKKQRGQISIDLRSKDFGDGYLLQLADNGVGFPDDIDIHSSTTLGLQLVTTLVNQIEGSIKLDRSKGTLFTIEFESPDPSTSTQNER